MIINEEKIYEIAEKLKFTITSVEVTHIINQANQMVGVIDEIEAIDTDKIEKMFLNSENENVFDSYDQNENIGQLFEDYPNFKENYFEIKKVRDDE